MVVGTFGCLVMPGLVQDKPGHDEKYRANGFPAVLIVFPRRSNRFAALKTSVFGWSALFLLMFAL